MDPLEEYPYREYRDTESWAPRKQRRQRKPPKPTSPAWAVVYVVLAIGNVLVAALGSGSAVQWIGAGTWVFLAAGYVWRAGRHSATRR